MRVYKLYFKLLKRALPTLLVYIVIFLAMTLLFTTNMQETNGSIFEESKVRMALINHDEESILLQAFKSYLEENSELVEIEESKEGMQDALFFRDVTYILTIPQGFTKDFFQGKDPVLEKYTVPDSAANHTVDLMVNNYFNTGKIYRNIENIREKELVEKIIQDLDVQVKVDLYSVEAKAVDNTPQIFYYNYLVYAMLSILILGMSSIMISFADLDIKRRNFASPLSLYRIQSEQILGHLTFASLCVLLFVALGFIVNPSSFFDKTSLLFILNFIVFTITALCIAYLVGSLTMNREVTNGIANIVGLGLSFVSGVFVPMELLGETTLKIARFTPAYWYTSNNSIIGNLTNFTWEHLSPIYSNLLIQLGFALALLTISLVINKKSSQAASARKP
ncbi:ABC transporter permease [Irregularibacter muris]|uniref:ABC transporter permease n=1 Tax=Irregularibacter muris TaxID=1796619 RepID=A0AAE3L086_9FIRM|nr:ABC transporter permease [Irregularibacter muris]MCR1899477.1 ABC transporter permease [Irregularibacter muris]